jgi:hypothetical protein
MPLTPVGPLSLPFAAAAELLAACPTWQQACGVDTAAAARTRIHLFDLDPRDPVTGAQPRDDLLPCAVLLDEDGLDHRRPRLSTGSGELLLEFLLPVDPALSDAERQLDFRNTVGAVLMQMLDLSRQPHPGGNHWGVTGWRKLVAPQVLTASESRFGTPDALWCAFLLEWVE